VDHVIARSGGVSAPRPVYTTALHGASDMSHTSSVHSNPNILGGTPVFAGTRVPAQSLFDYIEGGDTLDEFLRQFPSVTREQAVTALDSARDSLLRAIDSIESGELRRVEA